MSRNIYLASRLREVLLKGHWIANTNFRELLTDTSFEQATRQVGSLNTIAMLTYHINYYIAGLIRVLQGGKLDIRDTFSFAMNPLLSEAEWNRLRSTFLTQAEEFSSLVEQLPDARLDEAFVDEKYGTWYRNIEAIIEHSYYHMGQISLLKKLIRESS